MRARRPRGATGAKRIADLEARLEAAEETLRAIRSGEVDALVVTGPDGERVYTLAGAEQPYRVLVEAMTEGAATLDPSGAILYCNARFAEMLGRSLDVVIGSSMRDHVLPQDAAAFEALVASARRGSAKGEVSLDGAARGAVRVQLSLSVLASPPDLLAVVATDLSEIASLREALRERDASLAVASRELTERERTADALRESDRRKDEFLGVLSHELRNPLAPMRNALYVLDRSKPGSDAATRARDVIERQVDQLARLVDDLLDVTRIGRGKIRLQRARFDLVEIVRRAIEDSRAFFGSKHVELGLDLAREPVPVEGDAIRIAQVVGNLLHNAVKFTPVAGRVTVTVAREADRAVLRVEDTGVGISPRDRERLFEPFFQADDGISRSTGGLGLGLALAKGLVDLHAGSIDARSAGPGHGAEFVVRLPLAEGLAPDRPAKVERVPTSRRRVLVIEDNPDGAETLRMMLEMEGHEVEVAQDGLEGVARARAFRPEVVLCDIGLPEMDGFAVARTLRADGALRSTYLVALTGYALPEDLRRAAEAGFDLHLAKPPTVEQIQDAVARGRNTGAAPAATS